MPESFGAVVCIGSSYTLSSIAAKQGSAPLDAYAAWPSDRYTHGMLHTWLLQDCSLASKLSRTFSRRRLRAIEMRRSGTGTLVTPRDTRIVLVPFGSQ